VNIKKLHRNTPKMGSEMSSILFQPLLLGTAAALMIIGLVYQDKTTDSNNWGEQIFKIEMGVAIVVVIIAVLLGVIEAFDI